MPATPAAAVGVDSAPTRDSTGGNRPSRPIANSTRLWAISTTSTTVVRARSAPTLMTSAAHPVPTA